MMNYNDLNIQLPLSGGINSAAVACWLIESGMIPKNIYIFYADFEEHSPGTLKFVQDTIKILKSNFENVHVTITSNSVLDFFRKQNFIPHPKNSPCTEKLKISPMNKNAFDNGVFIDLVGYVKNELKRRSNRQQKVIQVDLFSLEKFYPIGEFSDDWCFKIVKKHIGWYPEIYDHKWNNPGFMEFVINNLNRFDQSRQKLIQRKLGRDKRIFKHNNCLPCKNMYPEEILFIEYFYPEHYKNSMILSNDLKKYWGRSEDDFYFTFGRDLGQESTCSTCKF